jgi:hypothetical protein
MLVAAVVILAGVVVVASGRGGQLAAAQPDYPPIDLGPVTSADVALLRPPSAAWGYNMRVTDEALEVIAKAVTERDVQIAALEQEVSDLRDQLGGGGRTATLDPSGRDPEPTEPSEPEFPEPEWPGPAEDTVAAAPSVSATRPEPIFHADDQGESADEVHFGPGFGGHDHAEAPAEASAPWGPAEPPDQDPLWEPAHPHPEDHAISWEAPPAPQAPEVAEAAEPVTVEAPAESPAEAPAEAAPEPAPEAHPGWSADPADTSPDATPVDPGGELSVPVTPPTGWRGPEPSVWDEASRQVEQEQGQPPAEAPTGQEKAAASTSAEFHWDDDPHQRVVWGAEHARAKAARAAEETLPNGEPADGDRD